MPSYYAIYKGRSPGIVTTWKECQDSINGFSGAIYKKFNTRDLAQQFIDEHSNSESDSTTKIPSDDTTLSPEDTKIGLTKLPINWRSAIDDDGDTYYYNINTKQTQWEFPVIPIRAKNEHTEYINIYTDGSLIRKQGTICAGFGIYIPSKHFEISRKLEGKKTNNRAELTAIISAIKMYSIEDNICLRIYTDSEYSIKIFGNTGIKYEKQNYMNKNKKVLNYDLVEQAVELSKYYILEFHHIRSHTSNSDEHSIGNDRADMLAVRGAVSDYIHSTTNLGEFILSFGKYKGESLKNIPPSYLEWVIHSSSFEELCVKKEEYRLEKEIIIHYSTSPKTGF